MKHAAHLALQRLIDDLVLLDAGFAAERLRDHGRRIMVAVAGEVADRHLGVGNSRLDHRFDIMGVHRHSRISPIRRFESRPATGLRVRPNLARPPFYVTSCRTIFPIQSLQSRPDRAAPSQRADRNANDHKPPPSPPPTPTPSAPDPLPRP